MMMGGNFANGKGNATVFFEYRQHADPCCRAAATSARARSSAATTGLHLRRLGARAIRAGSPTSATPATTSRSPNAAGDVRPYVGATDQFNFAPYNYFQRPDTRYLANSSRTTTRCPTSASTPNSTSRTTTRVAQIAPGGMFLQPFTLHDDNPLLSQSFKDAFGYHAAQSVADALHRPPQHRGRRTRSTTSRTSNYRYRARREGQLSRRHVELRLLVAVRPEHD